MDRYAGQMDEGREIVAAEARERLAADTELSWGRPSNGAHPLNLIHAGRTHVLLRLTDNQLADVPGSYRDSSGEDDHWAYVRAYIRDAVAHWKASQGP